MIARIWRGATHVDDADAYGDYLEQTGLLEYRSTPGNLGAYVLLRVDDDRAQFTVISLWSSFEAVATFAYDDVDAAVFYPEDDRFLIERDERVTHHDVIYAAPSGSLL